MTQERGSLKGIPEKPIKEEDEPNGAHQGTDHQDQVPWRERKNESGAWCHTTRFKIWEVETATYQWGRAQGTSAKEAWEKRKDAWGLLEFTHLWALEIGFATLMSNDIWIVQKKKTLYEGKHGHDTFRHGCPEKRNNKKLRKKATKASDQRDQF